MGNCERSISIRFRHPTVTASAITAMMDQHPTIAWTVGEQRMTRRGEPLPGTREETYWSLQLPSEAGTTLEECLQSILAGALRGRSRKFRAFRHSGGSIEFLVGIFEDYNCGELLNYRLLRRLATAGIDLALDFYGYFPIPEEGN